MLDAQRLGDFIDAHYCADGDRLFRMEQLPVLSVESAAAADLIADAAGAYGLKATRETVPPTWDGASEPAELERSWT